jgi:cysteine-rich repeat protein
MMARAVSRGRPQGHKANLLPRHVTRIRASLRRMRGERSDGARRWGGAIRVIAWSLGIAGCGAEIGSPPAECGNGRIELGERCDDGNLRAGDGCSAACTIEVAPRQDASVSDGALGDAESAPDAAEPDAAVADAGADDAGQGSPDAGAQDAAAADATAGDATTLDASVADAAPLDAAQPDASARDAAFADASWPDASWPDATAPDAAFADASAADAARADTGFADASWPDASAPDASSRDAAAPDAGFADAGFADAGFADAGFADAASIDAGAADAGSGDAGFAPAPSGFVPQDLDTNLRHGQSTTVADVDADGDPDVIGSISLTDSVRLYLNGGGSAGGGNGSFWAPVSLAPAGSIVAMGTSAADLDGDGDLDVAAVGLFTRSPAFSWVGELEWYENRGAQGWLPRAINTGSLYAPRAIAAGDLTGDGRAELVVGSVQGFEAPSFNPVGQGVRWLRNELSSGGSFSLPLVIDAPLAWVEQVLVVDVDRNGTLDVVACGRDSGEVVWYQNQRLPGLVDPNPTFARRVLASLPNPGGMAFLQADSDAALELVVMQADGTGGALALYDAPATITQPWVRQVIDATWGGVGQSSDVLRVAAGDLNGDGRTDFVASSRLDGNIRAYVRQASGWVRQDVGNLFGVTSVNAADLDGDGRDDVLTSTYELDPNFDRFTFWRTVP